MKKFFTFLVPPDNWKLPVIILAGILTGLGLFILDISNAASYLSDDPKVCINCHVMNPQYATWERGSHGRDVTCNDCHVPHNNFISKYWFKANDGLRHSTYFTFRWEPQVIQIKDAGKKVVQENCIRCHSNMVHPIALRFVNNESVEDQTQKYCWECHRETPHGRIHSLSSTPYARFPRSESVAPEWLERFLDSKQNKKN